MFRTIRGKYAKIVFETCAVFVYCVNARRAACGKGRGRGCVLFAFASAAPDPFLVRAYGTCRFPLHPRKDLTQSVSRRRIELRRPYDDTNDRHFLPSLMAGFLLRCPPDLRERPGNGPESQPPGVWLAALLSGRSEKAFRAKVRAKRKDRMTPYFSPR